MVKEVRIIPKSNARYFEIQYVYAAEINQRNLNKNNALAIDLGVNNLMTGVTNNGKTFIIDGKRLKSINQWYNKENARLQSIKDLQHIKGTTKRQISLTRNRNNKVNDYIHKAVVKVINYCINNDIGTIVLGYNKDYQKDSNIGKTNNQNFVNIPYGRLRDNLEYLCRLNDITLIIQEESYTSKASFWDKDDIPVFDGENTVKYIFSGKRIKRGLYKTSTGYVFNADINGALNILKKSNVVLLDELYARGEVNTPVRIRIA